MRRGERIEADIDDELSSTAVCTRARVAAGGAGRRGDLRGHGTVSSCHGGAEARRERTQFGGTATIRLVRARVEIKFYGAFVLNPRLPARHRRDACSIAWRCRYLTARQAPAHWLISTQAIADDDRDDDALFKASEGVDPKVKLDGVTWRGPGDRRFSYAPQRGGRLS